MWVILDNFGQVPYRDPAAPVFDDPIVLTGEEAVNFIVGDLQAAIDGLPAGGPGSGNSRPTKAAARYLLAKVLLNKHVYLGTSPDGGDMNQVVALVDQIAAEGYGLVEGYFDIFREALDNETIWFLPTGVGNRIWNGLHYNQAPEITGGGWNGFSTLAEYYDLFEGDSEINEPGSGQEERRGWVPDATNDDDTNLGIGYGFLIGQQYNVDAEPLQDRAKNPLVFTKELPGLVGNNERTGIRTIKYHPVNGGFTGHQIIFRYADAYLMKPFDQEELFVRIEQLLQTRRQLQEKYTTVAQIENPKTPEAIFLEKVQTCLANNYQDSKFSKLHLSLLSKFCSFGQ